MSYIVTVHMCGGSGGEAVPAIEVAHVATREEADAVEKWVHSHPGAESSELWALVYEIPEIQSVSEVQTQFEKNDYFEVWDE